MTSTAAPDVDQISGTPARTRWRQIVFWSIVALVAAVAIGVPAWSRSTVGAIRLQEGSYRTAPGSWEIQAGPTREVCFGVVPGSTIAFGVSFDNTDSHPVYLSRVEPPFAILPTTITMRRIDLRSTNPERPEQPFAPLTLKPGDEVMLLFTLQVPNDVEMSEGTHSFVSAITMTYRADNVDFDKDVPIGYWIGLDRPSTGTQPCQPEHQSAAT